jgi:hypothetical protein
MPIMPKRKATPAGHYSDDLIPEEEVTPNGEYEINSQYTHSKRTQVMRETQLNTPNAFNEKRKRLSQVNDLSHLNDVQPHGDGSILDSSDSSVSKAPCSGVIERVYLKNFKCHSLLEFQLHPYINFILGRNGSNFLIFK